MTRMLPKGNGVLIDLEATCCENNEFPRNQMEIIEIGAVAINSEARIIGEYNSFIKPVRNENLTEFCTSLTSISQTDVNNAFSFVEVAKSFSEWVAVNEIQWWGSWGDYDYNQFMQDVQYHRNVHPIPQPHVNLKQLFTENQKIYKKPGLAQAIKLAGLEFQGSHHRGIDDARNIAQLLPYIQGEKFINV